MKLKSFGCSFIFGSELNDAQNDLVSVPSQCTWPALIAQNFGYEYNCYAKPGSGNLQILERFLNEIRSDEPAFYVIGWTWIDRFDYIDTNLQFPWPGTKWNTVMPADESSISTFYYKHLQSEYSDKFKTLTYIRTAIDVLREKKSRFIMTYMDDLIFCQQWHISPAMNYLMSSVSPYLSDFDGTNFLQWSKNNNFKISDNLHPLDDAHRAAADLVIKDFDNWRKQ